MEGLADKVVVLAVRADPEPVNAALDRDSKGTVVQTYARALKAAIAD